LSGASSQWCAAGRGSLWPFLCTNLHSFWVEFDYLVRKKLANPTKVSFSGKNGAKLLCVEENLSRNSQI